MKHTITQLATTLDQAAVNAKPIQQISLDHSFDLEEAYQIQAASIHRRAERGDQLRGLKLGFTSKAKMEQMGVHDIIWGRLTDQMCVSDKGTIIRSQFIHPRVEPEIAFRICKKIDRVIALEEIPDFIDGVACALEVIDSRYENFKFSLEDVVADNCSSSAYVLGEWMDPKEKVSDLNISMLINGQEVQSGNSNAILGDPLASIIECSKMMEKYRTVIEPGAVLLAGAATSAVHIHTGDKIEGIFQNLGRVSFSVS